MRGMRLFKQRLWNAIEGHHYCSCCYLGIWRSVNEDYKVSNGIVLNADKTQRILTCTCHIPHTSPNVTPRSAQLGNYSTPRSGGCITTLKNPTTRTLYQ